MLRRKTIKLSEIKTAARVIAKTLTGGEKLALIGPLGAGKTTFVKALAKELKVKDKVSSPTFVLLRTFSGRLKTKPVQIYHFDLYRIKNFKEARTLGIEEIWNDKNNLVLMEWADKIEHHLPKKTLHLYFTP